MRTIVVLAALLVLTGACSDQATDPAEFPSPERVPVGKIPQPFDEAFYFLYGWDETEGPEPILSTLLAAGIPIRAAWVPDPDLPGPCMMFVQLTQLIVQLPRPDPRLRDHGFSQNAGNVHLGACNPWWLKYEFAH